MGHYLSEMSDPVHHVYDVVVAGLGRHRAEVCEWQGRYEVRAPGFFRSCSSPTEAVKELARWHRWDVLFIVKGGA